MRRSEQLGGSYVASSLGQQFSNGLLGLGLGSFTRVALLDIAILVDEIFGGRSVVEKGVPGGVVIVLSNGILQTVDDDSFCYVLLNLLELKLRRVYREYYQAPITVFFVPFLHIGKSAFAVNAGVSPEVHQHHIAPQML